MIGEGYDLPVAELLEVAIDARQRGPTDYLLSDLSDSERYIEDAMRYAIRAGDIDMMEIIDEAAGGPYMQFGRPLHGDDWQYECPLAASLGNLPMLQWLRERGYEFWQTKRAANLAGFPEVADWARANGATGME